nr:putative calmodulin-binding domain, plant [Tanacetum cinerariifolium]
MMFSALAISESPCQMACSMRSKNSNESRSLSPPFKKKKTQPVHEDGARSTPNYMKSTSSFEARKEQSPKTTIPKVARKMKMD